MNKQGAPDTSRGREASGKHEGLRHPIEEKQQEKQRLGDVGLDDQGEVAEDDLRDRRSSGAGSQEPGERKPRRH